MKNHEKHFESQFLSLLGTFSASHKKHLKKVSFLVTPNSPVESNVTEAKVFLSYCVSFCQLLKGVFHEISFKVTKVDGIKNYF
jgi:hypothetical protein